jgi:hypothetical protein
MEGHHKDECPTFAQYLAAGAPTRYQEDTARYARSGDIIPMSLSHQRNINIPQEAYSVASANQWDTITKIFMHLI